MMIMQQSLALYVPSRDADGNRIATDTIDATLDRVQLLMSRRFGGFTMTDATGGWVNDEGKIIRERIRIIRSWVASISVDDLIWIQDLAAAVGRELNQNCVSIETPGGLEFVAPLAAAAVA